MIDLIHWNQPIGLLCVEVVKVFERAPHKHQLKVMEFIYCTKSISSVITKHSLMVQTLKQQKRAVRLKPHLSFSVLLTSIWFLLSAQGWWAKSLLMQSKRPNLEFMAGMSCVVSVIIEDARNSASWTFKSSLQECLATAWKHKINMKCQ